MKNKKLNSLQEKKIREYIEKQDKDIDAIQRVIIDGILLHGLNNKETAALLFSVMYSILSTSNNKAVLEKVNIKKENLSIENVLLIQRILVEEYLKDAKQ